MITVAAPTLVGAVRRSMVVSYAGVGAWDEPCDVRTCRWFGVHHEGMCVATDKHMDNGAGWCVGSECRRGDHCIRKSRECPFQYTERQILLHRIEDARQAHQLAVAEEQRTIAEAARATERVSEARQALEVLESQR